MPGKSEALQVGNRDRQTRRLVFLLGFGKELLEVEEYFLLAGSWRKYVKLRQKTAVAGIGITGGC